MRLAAHSVGAVCALVLAIFIGLLFDRREVVVMEFMGFDPKNLIQGEAATVTWKTEIKRADCDGVVQRQIIDATGLVHTYNLNRSVINPVSPVVSQFTGSFVVPASAAPGVAIHRTTAERWCNPLQKFIWRMHDPVRDVSVLILARR